jgi:hypothetical protein
VDYQSRSAVSPNKTARDRLIDYASPRSDWAIGFVDEVWWSRFALPRVRGWQRPSASFDRTGLEKGDPDPKALACYGVLWQEGTVAEPGRDQLWLRFVTGRPVSVISLQFLQWCYERLGAPSASATGYCSGITRAFHVSKLVRTWMREHNQEVKREGKGVRVLPCLLPKQSRLPQSH